MAAGTDNHEGDEGHEELVKKMGGQIVVTAVTQG